MEENKIEQNKPEEQSQQAQQQEQPQLSTPIKPDILDYDDIRKMAPFFDGKPKLVKWLFHLLDMDDANWIHGHNCHTPGVPFCTGVLKDLNATITYNNGKVLDNLPEGAFITVSNHPFGAADGVMMIHIIGTHRPDYKFMVNMMLSKIGGMMPNFITVDALASDDPAKKAVSMQGISDTLKHVKAGHPMGFFPAGAVSKLTWKLRVEDREWQPVIMRLIQKLKVPVIPIYIHGHNSWISLVLGAISWKLRTLRLPSEMFRRKSYDFRVSVHDPIMPEEYAQYKTPEELGVFLKSETYKMKKWQR